MVAKPGLLIKWLMCALIYILMCLIQINNLRVFFKLRLLLWSLLNLQMYTHIYKFKPFLILFYLEHLSAVVFGKQECRDIRLNACVYVFVSLQDQ